MGSTVTPGAIITPGTKAPIPPPYRGLVDAATFGRLASRPDRVDPEAAAFFDAWLRNNGGAILLKDRSGNAVPNPQFFRIGTARLLGTLPASGAVSEASASAAGAAVTPAKRS